MSRFVCVFFSKIQYGYLNAISKPLKIFINKKVMSKLNLLLVIPCAKVFGLQINLGEFFSFRNQHQFLRFCSFWLTSKLSADETAEENKKMYLIKVSCFHFTSFSGLGGSMLSKRPKCLYPTQHSLHAY